MNSNLNNAVKEYLSLIKGHEDPNGPFMKKYNGDESVLHKAMVRKYHLSGVDSKELARQVDKELGGVSERLRYLPPGPEEADPVSRQKYRGSTIEVYENPENSMEFNVKVDGDDVEGGPFKSKGLAIDAAEAEIDKMHGGEQEESVMKKYVTREVMENITKGCYENWLVQVDEAIESYNSQMERVATFGNHVIVKNGAGDFFRLKIQESKVVSEEVYPVATMDESQVLDLLKVEAKTLVRSMLDGKDYSMEDLMDLMENQTSMKRWLWQQVESKANELADSIEKFPKAPFMEHAPKTQKVNSIKEAVERSRYFMNVLNKAAAEKKDFSEGLAGPIAPMFRRGLGDLSQSIEKALEVDSAESDAAKQAFTTLSKRWYDIDLVGTGLEKFFQPTGA